MKTTFGNMPFTGKSGRTYSVRHPRKDDANNLLKFANALIDEDTFITLSGQKLTIEEEEKYLNTLLKGKRQNTNYSVFAVYDGNIIGSADLRILDKRQTHVGELGIAILKHYRNDGIGKKLLTLLIEQAKKRNLRLLVLRVYEPNISARQLYATLGFTEVGTIPEAIHFRGTYVSEITMYLRV